MLAQPIGSGIGRPPAPFRPPMTAATTRQDLGGCGSGWNPLNWPCHIWVAASDAAEWTGDQLEDLANGVADAWSRAWRFITANIDEVLEWAWDELREELTDPWNLALVGAQLVGCVGTGGAGCAAMVAQAALDLAVAKATGIAAEQLTRLERRIKDELGLDFLKAVPVTRIVDAARQLDVDRLNELPARLREGARRVIEARLTDPAAVLDELRRRIPDADDLLVEAGEYLTEGARRRIESAIRSAERYDLLTNTRRALEWAADLIRRERIADPGVWRDHFLTNTDLPVEIVDDDVEWIRAHQADLREVAGQAWLHCGGPYSDEWGLQAAELSEYVMFTWVRRFRKPWPPPEVMRELPRLLDLRYLPDEPLAYWNYTQDIFAWLEQKTRARHPAQLWHGTVQAATPPVPAWARQVPVPLRLTRRFRIQRQIFLDIGPTPRDMAAHRIPNPEVTTGPQRLPLPLADARPTGARSHADGEGARDEGWSTGAKVAVGAGAVVLVFGLAYAARRRKGSRRRRRRGGRRR